MRCLNILIKSNILILSLYGLTLSAFCEDTVIVSKGDPAPFKGYLFSEDKAKETYIKLTNCDLKDDLLTIKDKKVSLFQENEEIYKARIEEFRKQNNDLVQKNIDNQKNSDIMKAIYFLGGAVLTTAIVFGVSNVQK